jgi:hypothetical protein
MFMPGTLAAGVCIAPMFMPCMLIMGIWIPPMLMPDIPQPPPQP